MTRPLSMTVSNTSEETVFASGASSTSAKMKATAKDRMVFFTAINFVALRVLCRYVHAHRAISAAKLLFVLEPYLADIISFLRCVRFRQAHRIFARERFPAQNLRDLSERY